MERSDRQAPPAHALEARWEVIRARDRAWQLGAVAEGDEDLLVRLEEQAVRVAGQQPAVDVDPDPPGTCGAVAAEAARRERYAPDPEELAQREGTNDRRLDVDNPGRVVGMERREERLVRADADAGRDGDASPVHEDVEVVVVVQDRSLGRERGKSESAETRAEALQVSRPGRRAPQLVGRAGDGDGRARAARRRAQDRQDDHERGDDCQRERKPANALQSAQHDASPARIAAGSREANPPTGGRSGGTARGSFAASRRTPRSSARGSVTA